MNWTLRRQLKIELAKAYNHLDEEAANVVRDLADRIAPPHRVVRIEDGVAFKFPGGYIAFGYASNIPDWEKCLLQEDDTQRSKEQFKTMAENALYCQGTTGLLELLVRYRYIKTSHAAISAWPNVQVFQNGVPCLTPQDLEEVYGDKREVRVTIAFKEGFVVFNFEKTITNPKKKAV